MRLLVVEDEGSLREDLAQALRINSYAVDTAKDGLEALELFEINDYDLILLDLNLPKLDGMEVLNQIRLKSSEVKILILSARGEVDDKVLGLDSGANDYLVKPFYLKELLARIRSLLNRKFEVLDKIIEVEGVRLNVKTKQVTVNGKEVSLMPKEYGILEYLMLNLDSYVSQEELLEHVWDVNADPFTSSVRTYLSYLRKKLGVNIIESKSSFGYIIRSKK